MKSISLCHTARATACQMSHCFLFVISQVENDRAQAPKRGTTGGVFHGVHLKCCWLDALSTATGLFVSWVHRTWQPHQSTRPEWFKLRLVWSGPAGGGIETESDSNQRAPLESSFKRESTLMLLLPLPPRQWSSFSHQCWTQKVRQ